MALRIPQPPDAIETLLDDNGISIDSTAERESDALGAYTTYYVSDPFGYTIELIVTNEE
ncbi:hypothetical protein [Halosimplex amylolyticum]|uniref:hypothetical protein n=1 Tax=Halosimplex amylolyticum TaxID=3396616 RepID=UPI003F573E22